MKKLISIVLLSLTLASCTSLPAAKFGKVSIRTSPNRAIVLYEHGQLKEGDSVSLHRVNWKYRGKKAILLESFVMNGKVDKIISNGYYEVKFESDAEFQEGDKIKLI